MNRNFVVGALLLAGTACACGAPAAKAGTPASASAPASLLSPAQWDRPPGGPGGWERDRWQRCERLRHWAHELRERLSYNLPPWERERAERRLWEVREQLRGNCGGWR